jgi:predicted glycoside hydrolase/deacetylase ChbG (UPF0249 family)
MKKLIIIGDDFGLSKEINAGIIAACQKGNMDGISLIANGEAFDDAVALIKKHPDLDVGLHLTLVELKPILSAQEIPSSINKNGYFYPDYLQFIKAYFSGKISLKEIDLEIGAQFEKVQQAGIRISRIDSHQQLHMLPGILEIVIKYARKHHITRIRYPYTPFRLSVRQFSAHPDKFLCGMLLNCLCVFQRRLLRKNRFIHPEYYCNVSNMGVDFEKAVQWYQGSRRGGHWEFSFHPATSSHELSKRYPRWRYHWEEEYHYLMHPDFQRRFQGSDITRNKRNDYAENCH